MAFSIYERPQVGISSIGIGGLQIDVSQKIAVTSSDLSYENGILYVNSINKKIQIPVSSVELKETIQLVQSSSDRIFQTSFDQIRVLEGFGSFPNTSNSLNNSKFLKKLFLSADLDFAGMVEGITKMPPTDTKHPYTQALKLLDIDNQYIALSTQWENPPLSWPQLYMVFEPNTQDLIRLDFKPQVLFRSNNYPVEVDANSQKIGERPYQPLVEDVKYNPNIYG